MNPSPHRTGPTLALGASITGIVGSLGPWITHPLGNANGTDGSAEGLITLGLFLLIAICAIVYFIGQESWGYGVFALSILAGGVGLWQAADISANIQQVPGAAIGWGLWLVIGSSFAAGIGGFLAAYFSTRPPAPRHYGRNL